MDAAHNGGRLTLKPETSGKRFPFPDGTNTGQTVYLTQASGNQIGLKTGGVWTLRTFTNEPSVSLVGQSAGVWDIFAYWDTGTASVKLQAYGPWPSETARNPSHAVVREGYGVLVKNGDDTRRYLGTVYLPSTTVNDSPFQRTLFNFYNRGVRYVRRDNFATGTNFQTQLNNFGWAVWNNVRLEACYDRTAIVRLMSHLVSYSGVTISAPNPRSAAPSIESVNSSAPTPKASLIEPDTRLVYDTALGLLITAHPRYASPDARIYDMYTHLIKSQVSPQTDSIGIYSKRDLGTPVFSFGLDGFLEQ
jgi:hypothetical protein